jgi:hypothetical protein
VLHDALFVAARGMPEGGVIVLVSDGRDENSATTVDDVARLCDTHHVRIAGLSLGRRVDQRALQRLALISKGELLGALAEADPATVAARVEASRAEIAAEIESSPAPDATTGTPAAPEAAPPVRHDAPESPSWLPWWLLPLLVGLTFVAVVVLWLQLRRRSASTVVCERCGARLEPWESSCSHCQIAELEEAVSSQPIAQSAVQDESVLDPSVFEKAPLPPDLDNTVVLDEQPVLVARQQGKPSRSYALPREEVFAVGRAPEVNTLQVEDATVSAQHFKIVPKEGEFYVVDLDTTNGTSVNHERIKVRKLTPGDVIRVGVLEFEFKMKVRRMG